MIDKIENLGQVFTTEKIVNEMIGLRQNYATVLEPSCGNGAFFNEISDCVGIELDSSIAPKGAVNIDFFDFSVDKKFETIIGNPPYVKYRNIMESTKEKLDMSLFDGRTNLYLFFIEKCIHHLNDNGELIFIVPRDFQKATSAKKLNQYMFEHGSFTYFRETGDDRIFNDACLNCVIFRWQKGLMTHTLDDGRKYSVIDGQIVFASTEGILLKEFANVRVGAVSGKDSVFASDAYGNRDFVCSTTYIDGKTRKMIYEERNPYLETYKDMLMARKAKKFDEHNWWTWVRAYKQPKGIRIYVNGKTRHEKPFFVHPCNDFDGSILGIFPKRQDININELMDDLNHVDWESIGFKSGGRYMFSQNALEHAILPDTFRKYK